MPRVADRMSAGNDSSIPSSLLTSELAFEPRHVVNVKTGSDTSQKKWPAIGTLGGPVPQPGLSLSSNVFASARRASVRSMVVGVATVLARPALPTAMPSRCPPRGGERSRRGGEGGGEPRGEVAAKTRGGGAAPQGRPVKTMSPRPWLRTLMAMATAAAVAVPAAALPGALGGREVTLTSSPLECGSSADRSCPGVARGNMTGRAPPLRRRRGERWLR